MIEKIKKEICCVMEKNKILLAVGLFLVILAVTGTYFYRESVAAAATVGTVNTNSGSLSVRNGPGTTHSKIGTLAKGTTVTILGEESGWYRIAYGGGEGYVSKDYIGNVHMQETDDKYYKSLLKAGFTESYAQSLALLHSQYPNWQFEPVITGLNWTDVISEESKLGKNLIQKNGNDAQKSTAVGAYDWQSDSWYGFDGASWVCASEAMISYAMDPRNFLDSENIFQFESLSYQPYQTKEGTAQLLSDTFMAGNYKDTDGKKKSYADTFLKTGSDLGVSPYHLAARCKQEQGTKGTSDSISGTYSGYKNYFNYFNIGAYAANGKTAVENGLVYAKAQKWNSRYKSILGGSTVVANNYILKGQNTIYFEKFNVVNASNLYGHQYMTNVQAAISEGKSSKKAYSDLNQAFVFRIPVYNNMPEAPCAMPTGGNPNNWLSSLKVDKYSMTPSFQGSVTKYSLIVDQSVKSIKVSASPVASTSTVSGSGTIKLDYGKNKISIVCKAQNGEKKTYTLNVVRNKPEGGSNTGNAGNVTYGDINQDGKISNSDLVLLKKQILKIENLTGDNFAAADINQDGKVSNVDLVMMKKHILGIETIKQ